MYKNFCEAVRGGPAGYLMKVRPLDSSAFTTAKAGRVVSLNDSGDFVLGLGTTGHAMPLWLFTGPENPSLFGGDSETPPRWVDPTTEKAYGAIAYVATGAYEIQTTEFDDQQEYACNDLLKADSDGKVTNQDVTVYVDQVVGVCSVHENAENIRDPYRGFGTATEEPPRGKNANGYETLTFWPVYLPGTVVTS